MPPEHDILSLQKQIHKSQNSGVLYGDLVGFSEGVSEDNCGNLYGLKAIFFKVANIFWFSAVNSRHLGVKIHLSMYSWIRKHKILKCPLEQIIGKL